MGLEFNSGAEGGYAPPELLGDNSGTQQPASIAVASDFAHSGTYAVKANLINNDDWERNSAGTFAYTRSLVGDTVTAGLACRVDNLGDLQNIIPLMVKCDGSNDSFIAFVVEADRSINVRISTAYTSIQSGTIIAAAAPAGTFVVDTFFHFELEVLFSTTVGTVRAAINGIEVVNETGLDLWPGAGSPTTAWDWGWRWDQGLTGDTNVWIDDAHAGSEIGLVGKVNHEACVANSSLVSDGAGSDGNSVDNWQLVDEIPFSDADYVDLDAAAETERYGFADRTLTGDIIAVSVLGQVHDPDAGSVTANAFIQSNGTDDDGGSIVLTSTPGSKLLAGPFENDPDTAAPWTTGGFNAMSGGVKVSAVA